VKKIKIFIFMFIILALFNLSVYADGIKVYINSVEVRFDVPPIIENGRTLVPMRAIFEALGAEVYWDDNTKTAAAYKGDTGVAVQVDNFYANKNDSAVELDVAPKIIDGRMLVPLRFIGEAFDNDVNWDNDSRTVTIASNTADESIEPISNSEGGIVGYWSDTHFANLRVDAYSGMPLDDYSGEWYAFWDDGVYVHLMTASGSIINGTVSHKGKYTVDLENGTITFCDIKENWLPSKAAQSLEAYTDKTIADYTVSLEISDENQTISIGSTLWESSTKFIRMDSE
jgi:hypothetical protein